MHTFMVITLLVIALLSLGALWLAVKRAVRGYEDELGFHEGIESPISSVTTTELPAAEAEALRATRSGRKKIKAEAKDHGQLLLSQHAAKAESWEN